MFLSLFQEKSLLAMTLSLLTMTLFCKMTWKHAIKAFSCWSRPSFFFLSRFYSPGFEIATFAFGDLCIFFTWKNTRAWLRNSSLDFLSSFWSVSANKWLCTGCTENFHIIWVDAPKFGMQLCHLEKKCPFFSKDFAASWALSICILLILYRKIFLEGQ